MKGTFVISLDTEFSWGMFDNKNIEFIYNDEFGNKIRLIIDELLEIFNKYNISATWAIVGHLFLSKCKKIDGIKHPEIKHPNHKWFHDWYKKDPCTNIKEDPSWYGKDVLIKIKNTEPKQDIGSHSFSHCIFSDSGCDKEVAKSELKKCIKLAKEYNINLKSFVFPRNEIDHLNILKKNDFIVFRGKTLNKNIFLSNYLQKFWRVIEDIFALTPLTGTLQKTHEGLYKTPSSLMWRSRRSWRRVIPIKSRVNRSIKGIDRAIENQEIFHLWSHPLNFYFDTEKMLNGFEKVIRYAYKKREEQKLNIENMHSVIKRQK